MILLYIFLSILCTFETEACGTRPIFSRNRTSSVCGDSFYWRSGKFGAPSTSRSDCRWYILRTLYPDERIILNITHLNIPKTANCSLGYVEVRDGTWSNNSSLLGKFCGNEPINPVISTGSALQISHHKHGRYSSQSFSATYESICGGIILLENGMSLKYPDSARNYLPDKKCIWYINAPENHQVMVKFESFDLENHCWSDYVEILDGSIYNNSVMGRFCGNTIPPVMTSTSNKLLIKFVSDANIQKSGFLANMIADSTECGGILLEPSGRINRTTSIIRHNVTCIWKIITTPGNLIMLNVTVFNITANTTRSCYEKKLEVLYHNFQQSEEHLGTFCGLTNSVVSKTNELEIRYTSQDEVPGSMFFLDYSTKIDCSIQSNCHHDCVNNSDYGIQCSCEDGYTLQENNLDCKRDPCDYEISSPSGYIHSPNYPQNYSKELNCTWRFRTTPGHRINITFLEFKLESSSNCIYDHVRLYVKSSSNENISSHFCGIYNTTIVKTSSSEEIEMFFRSDKSNTDIGFNASYSPICGGRFNATVSEKYIFSHPGFSVSNYPDNLECEWEIFPIAGHNFVRIAVDILGMETSKNCSSDFVEIFDATSSRGKFCDMNELPEEFLSERFVIRFHSNHVNNARGFQIKYKAVNEN